MRELKLVKYGSVLIITILALLTAFPLFVTLMGTLKTQQDLFLNLFGLPHKFIFANYYNAWVGGKYGSSYFNSLFITVTSVLGLIVIGSAAAYPIARSRSRKYDYIYKMFIAAMIIPPIMTLMPLYKIIKILHLYGSYWSVIIVYITGGLSLAIFLYAGFIKSLPTELDDAAAIDGCRPVSTFYRIIFPLLKPVTATIIIFQSVGVWNDFMIQLLFLNNGKRGIALALYTFKSGHDTEWPLLFAGVVITVLPLLIVFFTLQDKFVKGLTMGSVK